MADRFRPHGGNAGVFGVSYYDLVLWALPVPLVVGLLAGYLFAVPPRMGLAAGAVLSALALAHGLFGNPPTRRGPRGPANGPSA